MCLWRASCFTYIFEQAGSGHFQIPSLSSGNEVSFLIFATNTMNVLMFDHCYKNEICGVCVLKGLYSFLLVVAKRIVLHLMIFNRFIIDLLHTA